MRITGITPYTRVNSQQQQQVQKQYQPLQQQSDSVSFGIFKQGQQKDIYRYMLDHKMCRKTEQIFGSVPESFEAVEFYMKGGKLRAKVIPPYDMGFEGEAAKRMLEKTNGVVISKNFLNKLIDIFPTKDESSPWDYSVW